MGLICNKAAKIMITSIFARRPFIKLNLLPKLKTFAKRGLLFSIIIKIPLIFLWKFKLLHKNKHKFHTLSCVLILRHLKYHIHEQHHTYNSNNFIIEKNLKFKTLLPFSCTNAYRRSVLLMIRTQKRLQIRNCSSQKLLKI